MSSQRRFYFVKINRHQRKDLPVRPEVYLRGELSIRGVLTIASYLVSIKSRLLQQRHIPPPQPYINARNFSNHPTSLNHHHSYSKVFEKNGTIGLYLPERLLVRSTFPLCQFSKVLTLVYSACGPQGTGCSCPKDKCNCPECPNKAHTAQVRLRFSLVACGSHSSSSSFAVLLQGRRRQLRMHHQRQSLHLLLNTSGVPLDPPA